MPKKPRGPRNPGETADKGQREMQSARERANETTINRTTTPTLLLPHETELRADNNRDCLDWRDIEGTGLDEPTTVETRANNCVMQHMGQDSEKTRHGIVPRMAEDSAAWIAANISDEERDAHNRVVNARYEVMNASARPHRLKRDADFVARREKLQAAAGEPAPPSPEDMAADRKLRLRQFFDGVMHAETLSGDDQAREIAAALEIEKILTRVHKVNLRAAYSKHPAMAAFLQTTLASR